MSDNKKNNSNVISLADEALKRGISRHHTIELLMKKNPKLFQKDLKECFIYDNLDPLLFDNLIIPSSDEDFPIAIEVELIPDDSEDPPVS